MKTEEEVVVGWVCKLPARCAVALVASSSGVNMSGDRPAQYVLVYGAKQIGKLSRRLENSEVQWDIGNKRTQ